MSRPGFAGTAVAYQVLADALGDGAGHGAALEIAQPSKRSGNDQPARREPAARVGNRRVHDCLDRAPKQELANSPAFRAWAR